MQYIFKTTQDNKQISNITVKKSNFTGVNTNAISLLICVGFGSCETRRLSMTNWGTLRSTEFGAYTLTQSMRGKFT